LTRDFDSSIIESFDGISIQPGDPPAAQRRWMAAGRLPAAPDRAGRGPVKGARQMNRCGVTTAVVLLALLAVFCRPAAAEEVDQAFLGIITGEPRSTAHQIGMDLKALAMQHNLHLAVYNSTGAVENIYAVYQRPGNHLGLVQSDVLAFVAKVKSDPRLERIAEKIKWVYPLQEDITSGKRTSIKQWRIWKKPEFTKIQCAPTSKSANRQKSTF